MPGVLLVPSSIPHQEGEGGARRCEFGDIAAAPKSVLPSLLTPLRHELRGRSCAGSLPYVGEVQGWPLGDEVEVPVLSGLEGGREGGRRRR